MKDSFEGAFCFVVMVLIMVMIVGILAASLFPEK